MRARPAHPTAAAARGTLPATLSRLSRACQVITAEPPAAIPSPPV